MTKQEQVLEKFNNLVEVSRTILKIDLPEIEVRFDLRGRSAGQAKCKSFWGKTSDFVVRFNRDMINGNGFDHIINDTVPHELAHIIAYFTGTDFGHGKAWKKLCIALGGSGERCHNEEVTPARVMQEFLYNTTCGRVVKVSKIRHNRIQNENRVYSLSNGGKIIRDSWRYA